MPDEGERWRLDGPDFGFHQKVEKEKADIDPLSRHVADFFLRFQDFQLGIFLADRFDHRIDDLPHRLLRRIDVEREKTRLLALHRHAPRPGLDFLIHERPVLGVIEANSRLLVERGHGEIFLGENDCTNSAYPLSLIHISEPTRLLSISY